MTANQAPPSLGFFRQEHWSGLPFPSPMHESEKWKWSCSVVSDPQRPHGLQTSRLLCPWDFLGKSTGVGCHCLLLQRNYSHLNLWLSFLLEDVKIWPPKLPFFWMLLLGCTEIASGKAWNTSSSLRVFKKFVGWWDLAIK